MSFGSRPGILARAAVTTAAARSSGRMSLSEPLNARPMGLRAVETMTASDMIPRFFVGSSRACWDHSNRWSRPTTVSAGPAVDVIAVEGGSGCGPRLLPPPPARRLCQPAGCGAGPWPSVPGDHLVDPRPPSRSLRCRRHGLLGRQPRQRGPHVLCDGRPGGDPPGPSTGPGCRRHWAAGPRPPGHSRLARGGGRRRSPHPEHPSTAITSTAGPADTVVGRLHLFEWSQHALELPTKKRGIMSEAVIVSTARSPIGRAFKGSLKDIRPDDLAAAVVTAALAKIPGLDPKLIDDLYLGCAEPSGEQGANMARVVAILAGFDHLPGATINRFC